jgi:hypothetical protein
MKKKVVSKGDFNQFLLNLDYKQPLVKFVNAKSRKKAQTVIIDSELSWFNFKTPTLEVIEILQKRLRKLFDELNDAIDLSHSDMISEFTFDYIPIRHDSVIEVQKNGTLGESTVHLMNLTFQEIITHCVIKIFSDPRSVRQLHRCENIKCNKYFMGDKKSPTTGPNKRKYCSKKCKRFVLEQRRTAQKYHRDHKRKKRKDPDSPLSYFGYKNKS